MITMKKRLIAIICCVAVLFAGLYVSQPQSAEAADVTTSGTLTIDTASFNSVIGWNPGRVFNIEKCIATFDGGNDNFANAVNSLSDAFVDDYIKFGGGMTKADFMNGLSLISYYHSSNRTLQINWSGRTEAFTAGWSFTIAQGTPIAYKLSDGTMAYLALDREYVFTFKAGNETWSNVIAVTAYKTGTFSLATNPSSDIGNGIDGSQNYRITISNDAIPDAYTYHDMTKESEYDGYIDFNGVNDSARLSATGLCVKYILVNDASTRVIQVADWGNWREELQVGDYWAYKKGMPIYWTSGGENYKAVLDATYVYYVTGSNTDHTQTYRCFKFDSETNTYGLKPFSSKSTNTQSNGYIINIVMSESITSGPSPNYVTQTLARKYYDFAGWTDEELEKYGVRLDLLIYANVLQLVINGAGVNALEVGDTITLKDGLPIAYSSSSGEYIGATLKGDYTITVTAKTNTTDTSVTTGGDGSVTYSMIETGTYGLTGSVSNMAPEENAMYQNNYFDAADFADAKTTFSGKLDTNTIINNYFYAVRGGKTVDLATEGWYFNYYYLDGANKMLRYYCPNTYYSFTDGDYIIWRQGLPITYTTTKNEAKTVALDKDYGFVWSSAESRFVYDASLVYTEPTEQTYTTEITAKTIKGLKTADYYALNISMTDAPDLSAVVSQEVRLLSNTVTAPYIDICGIDATELVKQGVEVKYIPVADVFQIILGADHTWLTVGNEITFKEGMPIPVTVNDETVTVTLQNTITYQVESITTDSPYVTMAAYAETQEFYIDPSCDGIKNEGVVNLKVQDAEGKATILGDCASGGAYDNSRLSYATIAKYMDFCGFNASELESYGVYVRLAAGDGNQLMQIYPGTMPADMIAGETVLLKKGLPLTYTTTAGYKKTITLAKDYTFVIGEGVTVGDVTYDCRWRYTETEPSVWRLKGGVVNQVIGSETQPEGYFNNLPLGSSPLLDEQTSLSYTFTTEQMEKYIDFAGLDASTYDIEAIAIITENDQVVQLRWGSASSEVAEDQTVTFKAGLPIVVNGTVVYQLETDIVYTIEKSANGKNGFCLSNIVEVTKTQSGDADGDYILNVNDVNLIREALAELVITDVDTQDATEDDKLDSRDLVRAKANFDIEESEANGTETYTLLAEKEIGFQTMEASTDDRKAVAKSITYDLNANLGNMNYLRLTYKTDTDLRGEFIYTVNGGSAVTEEFFLEADEAQFEQFLDVYRSNGLNGVVPNGSIVLKQIVLYNVSTTSSTNVRLYKVEAAARTLVTNDMLWAQDEEVKIGVDLNMGGSLAWMECLKYDVYEYTTGNNFRGESIIGTKEQCEVSGGTAKMTTGVNLINIRDLGRQIQQSYYSVPTNQQDWDGSTFSLGTYGDVTDWPYNPVQAGDSQNNQSQIVDYRVIDTDGDKQSDVIYVKTRAMDWSYAETHNDSKGRTTESYMEAWYRINDALVYVDNRFIDWSGYDYSVEDKTQEFPAVYLGQGLNTLVSDKAGETQKDTNLGFWEDANAYKNTTTQTDWYAFVNSEADDAFGVGIYIPNIEQTVAGRVYDHRNIGWLSVSGNQNADECPILDLGYSYLNDSYKNQYQNCFVSNASYIAPVCSGYMKGYEDYSYTYVLTADTLNNISGSFATLKENEAVDNSSLEKWEIKPNS